MNGEIIEISRVLFLAALSFTVAFIFAPILIRFLIKNRMGKQIRMEGAPIYNQLHQKKEGTPTMGGIVVWLTVFIIAMIFWAVGKFASDSFIGRFDFISGELGRRQTWLPLGVFIASALVGMGDDLLGILRIGPKGGGLTMRYRLVIYAVIAIVGAWWFYVKLGFSGVSIPFLGNYDIGWWYILFFIFVIVASSFSVNETDGLDGLVGGVLIAAFGAYAVIAFFQGQYNLAAFDAVIIGALLAFLWYNVYPARFFMGDTGAMSLGVTLGVMAMLTQTAFLLPFFGSILVLESVSVILQLASKKIRGGKKIFYSTPIHHHFEAKGWPEMQVTMRFWIISGMTAALGLILYFLDNLIF